MADEIDFEGQPYGGPFQIDVQSVAHLLFDLAPGVIGRTRRELPNLNKVLLMLAAVMPTQAAIVAAMMKGTQMKPAFCIQSSPPCASGCGAPPTAPKTPAMMTSGCLRCM